VLVKFEVLPIMVARYFHFVDLQTILVREPNLLSFPVDFYSLLPTVGHVVILFIRDVINEALLIASISYDDHSI